MLREKNVAQTTLTVMPCMNHNKHFIVSSNINNMNNNILKKYSLSVNLVSQPTAVKKQTNKQTPQNVDLHCGILLYSR